MCLSTYHHSLILIRASCGFLILVDLFTGLVAPTTCSLTICLTTCMVYLLGTQI